MIRVSVGICAYNEERTIGKLLQRLLDQKLRKVSIDEIIVISSGSTDKTDDIVRMFSKEDDRITLLRQKRREGKASAINMFLKYANNSVCVLESADTLPEFDAIEKLCLPFLDESVGMTGGRPVPINDKNTFMGYVGHLIWELHHQISLKSPKFGEMIAFRKVIDSIPKNIAVDEAWIEATIKRRGYKVVYVPEAICYNKAPENLRDFIKQRRRINFGHLYLKYKLKYEVSTMRSFNVLKGLVKIICKEPNKLHYIMGATLLEAVGKMLAYYDLLVGKDHAVWDIAESTKELSFI